MSVSLEEEEEKEDPAPAQPVPQSESAQPKPLATASSDQTSQQESETTFEEQPASPHEDNHPKTESDDQPKPVLEGSILQSALPDYLRSDTSTRTQPTVKSESSEEEEKKDDQPSGSAQPTPTSTVVPITTTVIAQDQTSNSTNTTTVQPEASKVRVTQLPKQVKPKAQAAVKAVPAKAKKPIVQNRPPKVPIPHETKTQANPVPSTPTSQAAPAPTTPVQEEADQTEFAPVQNTAPVASKPSRLSYTPVISPNIVIPLRKPQAYTGAPNDKDAFAKYRIAEVTKGFEYLHELVVKWLGESPSLKGGELDYHRLIDNHMTYWVELKQYKVFHDFYTWHDYIINYFSYEFAKSIYFDGEKDDMPLKLFRVFVDYCRNRPNHLTPLLVHLGINYKDVQIERSDLENFNDYKFWKLLKENPDDTQSMLSVLNSPLLSLPHYVRTALMIDPKKLSLLKNLNANQFKAVFDFKRRHYQLSCNYKKWLCMIKDVKDSFYPKSVEWQTMINADLKRFRDGYAEAFGSMKTVAPLINASFDILPNITSLSNVSVEYKGPNHEYTIIGLN